MSKSAGSKFAGLEIEVERPQRMVLVHPTTRQPLRDQDGQPAYIDVYSSDSSIARAHNRAVQQRRLNTRGRGRLSTEQLEAEAIDLLAALTAGWRLVKLSGEPLDVPFTPENARELYAAPSLAWIREQVDEFAVERANFPVTSSTN